MSLPRKNALITAMLFFILALLAIPAADWLADRIDLEATYEMQRLDREVPPEIRKQNIERIMK